MSHVQYSMVGCEVIEDYLVAYPLGDRQELQVVYRSRVIEEPSLTQLNEALDNCLMVL